MEPRDPTLRWYNQVSSFGKAWSSAHSGRCIRQRDCLSSVMRMMLLPSSATILYVKLDTHQSFSHATPACSAFPNLIRKTMICLHIMQTLVCSTSVLAYKPSKILL